MTFSRRGGGRRFGARGGAAVQRRVFAVNGWDTSTLLATASGAGVAGHATNGVSALVLFYLTAVPAAATSHIAGRSGTNQGWSIRSNTANFTGLFGNGAASASSPNRTLTSADVGKIHLGCVTCDGSAVYTYFDGVQVGTSTALAGYSVVATRHVLGTNIAPGNPATDFAIIGHCGRDSHLSLANFQTICAATKALGTGRLALGGISMDHQWDAPTSATVPATFTDVIGGQSMTFVSGSEANLVSAAYSVAWGF